MLSYRRGGFDQTLVRQVCDYLSWQSHVGADQRRVEVFQDEMRLQLGREFQSDVMRALVVTQVAVPFVSVDALRNMYKLTKDSPCDNVLLEWSMMHELLAAKRLRACLPIFIGKPKVQQSLAFAGLQQFDFGAAANLPPVVPQEVVVRVEKFFEEEGLGQPSSQLRTRTVRDIVQGMFKILSVDAATLPQRKVAVAIGYKVLEQIRDAHANGTAPSGWGGDTRVRTFNVLVYQSSALSFIICV
jgi:hypothetical protein